MRYSVVFAIALLMAVGTALPAAIAYVGDDVSVWGYRYCYKYADWHGEWS